MKENYKRDIPDDVWGNSQDYNNRKVKLVLRIEASMAYRLYDEFDQECIQKNTDGSFIVTVTFPEDEWVYGYVLSYGNYAEVLEPTHIRDIIKRRFEEGLKKYL